MSLHLSITSLSIPTNEWSIKPAALTLCPSHSFLFLLSLPLFIICSFHTLFFICLQLISSLASSQCETPFSNDTQNSIHSVQLKYHIALVGVWQSPLVCIYMPFVTAHIKLYPNFCHMFISPTSLWRLHSLFSYVSGTLIIPNRCIPKESRSLQLWGEQGILKNIDIDMYTYLQSHKCIQLWKLMEYSYCC